MLEWENGKLLDSTTLLLEFYYLLKTRSYKLAIILLSQDYALELRNQLNKIFLEDDDKILKHIIYSPDLTKSCVLLSLFRQLDGIALHIINNSDTFMDEEILEKAIEYNCNLFLEYHININKYIKYNSFNS